MKNEEKIQQTIELLAYNFVLKLSKDYFQRTKIKTV